MDKSKRLRSDSVGGPSPTQIQINKIKRPIIIYDSAKNSESAGIPKVVGFEPSTHSSNGWTKVCWEKISSPFRRFSATKK